MENCDICNSELNSVEVQNWKGIVKEELEPECPNGHKLISEVTLCSDSIKIDEAISRLVAVVTSNSYNGGDFILPDFELIPSEVTVEPYVAPVEEEEETPVEGEEEEEVAAQAEEGEATEEPEVPAEGEETPEESEEEPAEEEAPKTIQVTVTPDASQVEAYPYAQVDIDGKWYDLKVLDNPVIFNMCKNHFIKINWTVKDIETILFKPTSAK